MTQQAPVELSIARPRIDLVESYLDMKSEMRDRGEQVWESTLPRADEMHSDFVARVLRAESNPEAGLVPETTYWAVCNQVVVGRISMRHRLNQDLKEYGGHIGYEVRPSARRRGFANEMLRQILNTPKAREIGRLLLTCSPENVASKRTIQKNGGVFFGTRYVDRVQRETSSYWIDLNRELIPVTGGHLAAWSIGHGPPLIFLHGGPGDTHHYMMRMAEPLFDHFRCVFFDQRGTGASSDFARTPDLFRLDHLLADIIAVQDHFRLGPVGLIGHSWGALYALYACIWMKDKDPSRVAKAALVSMGPLDEEMERATSAHLLSTLSPQEQQEWQGLRAGRNRALAAGLVEDVRRIDRDLMRLRVRVWIRDPRLRESFLVEFFQDPPTDREINRLIWEAQSRWFNWKDLKDLRTPLWICSGADDSVPVAQTQRMGQMTPNAQTLILEECGHLPWLEHANDFYAKLRTFLSQG